MVSEPNSLETQYLSNLFAFDWVKTKSPAGATQWIPKDGQAANLGQMLMIKIRDMHR